MLAAMINKIGDKALRYSIWIFLSLTASILIGVLFTNSLIGNAALFFSIGYFLVYIGIIGMYFILPFILIRLVWLYKKEK